ncbi:hypothetical protein [Mycobacterium branderi]|uniref:Uncharacterized protein n=1 Tax=Mycobacterium branderi TaxID=43348 RepID=A0A7I7VY87_9MYCO|nr:hypothetical protein [Mycobacterium branderi]MCV7233229.1 hypothetical protein [Mycobacterium branderi]ORA41302.1 hypothetical protein BST20_04110 [Mycobacterium branderi]BBZ10344.1 hypothetical protein MBRA_05390 [Mycobacterium branderi]
MSPRFDVAARLAQGRPAVEHAQTYVSACRALGYQHPDLTAHDGQVLDWYETEDGLDLQVLDDDCAALWAAVNAAEEALARQREQIGELAAAWRGAGADAAMQFLRRHCETASVVAARVRAAAESCSVLRDKLWHAVDGKAATAIGVDDRSSVQRPAWLAAAHTVTTGSTDPSAEDLVREQLMPYVDKEIRDEWLILMRSITASVAAAYDAAVDAVTAAPDACFAIPGDSPPQPLRDEPAPPPSLPDEPVAAPPVDTVPAAISTPPPSAPAAIPADVTDDLPPAAPLSDLAAPLGDANGMSTGAGGLGSVGGLASGIGGVVGAIVLGIGGLLGSLAEGLADSSAPDDLPFDDAVDDDEPLDEEADDETDDPDKDEAGEEGQNADEDTTSADENPSATDELADNAAAPPAEPPPMEEPPPAEPPPPAEQPLAAPPDGSTPCEIAADELPQAGQ